MAIKGNLQFLWILSEIQLKSTNFEGFQLKCQFKDKKDDLNVN